MRRRAAVMIVGVVVALALPGVASAKGGGTTSDDFTKPSSGFRVFQNEIGYGEYLRDGHFRMGLLQPASVSSLRAAPKLASADVRVVTGASSVEGDTHGVGVACGGTGPTSFTAGYVTLNGTAGVLRFQDGQVAERSDATAVPAGLFHDGALAENRLRMTCAPARKGGGTAVVLWLNGTKVADAQLKEGGEGRTGLFVASDTGTAEFLFSDFSVRAAK